MSASNWAICPRCLRLAQQRMAELQTQMAESYGVLPLEEFDKLRAEAEKPIDWTPTSSPLATFREDYEIYGASTGRVTVGYHGYCSECGLRLDFAHEHPISV